MAKNFLYIDTQTIIRLVEIHHFFQWRRRRKSPTQKFIRMTVPRLIINTRVCEIMCCEESKNIVYIADISHRSWCDPLMLCCCCWTVCIFRIIEIINNKARHNLINAKCRWCSNRLDGAGSFWEPLGQTKVMKIRQRETQNHQGAITMKFVV